MAAQIDFINGVTNRYRSVLHRLDGVDVELDGGSYNKVGGRPGRIPHDIAHLIVEAELALTTGVWGVLGAGGLFPQSTVIGGRQAPHAAERARAIVGAAGDRITQAEILTRVVCDVSRGVLPRASDALRRAVGERWWTDDLTADALERSRTRLAAAAATWAALAPGEAFTQVWALPLDPTLATARPRRRRR